MECSEIIAIIDIGVTALIGIAVATFIAKGQTKERFLKEYFTKELTDIKDECKSFFDDICYDKQNARDIKTGFKIISMRAQAYEENLKEVFKNADCRILTNLSKIQLEITGSEEYNDQYQNESIKFSPRLKKTIFEYRSLLLSEFSRTIITINKASIRRRQDKR